MTVGAVGGLCLDTIMVVVVVVLVLLILLLFLLLEPTKLSWPAGSSTEHTLFFFPSPFAPRVASGPSQCPYGSFGKAYSMISASFSAELDADSNHPLEICSSAVELSMEATYSKHLLWWRSDPKALQPWCCILS